MSASGQRSQLKLLILIIKECLRGGVGSECLFNGCLQSEQHQDGARLRACLLYLKNLFFFFLLLPFLPSAQHRRRTAAHKQVHNTNTTHPVLGTTTKKIVWKQKQTGRKKRRSQTSAAARRGAVFSAVVVFLQHDLSLCTATGALSRRVHRQQRHRLFSFQENNLSIQ